MGLRTIVVLLLTVLFLWSANAPAATDQKGTLVIALDTLASYPKLIVLDEPVSALDVSIRAQIMNLLKRLQQQSQVSYLLVAHNLATVRYMAHHTAVMYLGQIVEHAATEALYTNPLHPYTKALFSAALPAHSTSNARRSSCREKCPRRSPPPRLPLPSPLPLREARMFTGRALPSGVAPDHKVSCHLYV
jgi:ABC-type oligopeptide transport system ATPase subunit